VSAQFKLNLNKQPYKLMPIDIMHQRKSYTAVEKLEILKVIDERPPDLSAKAVCASLNVQLGQVSRWRKIIEQRSTCIEIIRKPSKSESSLSVILLKKINRNNLNSPKKYLLLAFFQSYQDRKSWDFFSQKMAIFGIFYLISKSARREVIPLRNIE
jgi:hypothetical protein